MSVHLLLSAGRGPQECAWALARILHRLEADATRHNLETHRAETVPGDRAGTYRSVLIQITGDGAEAFAALWTGTLCWQAPSPYRASTGRKNWYVIAQPCQVDTPRTTFAEADVDIVACRTGGPGGQHRNKASTAVRATHRPTGIVVVVDTERQFSLNRRIAIRLLRQRVEHGDEAAGRAATTARWRIHDELVRGNPTRIERPEPSKQDLAPQKQTRRRRRQSTGPRPPPKENRIRQHTRFSAGFGTLVPPETRSGRGNRQPSSKRPPYPPSTTETPQRRTRSRCASLARKLGVQTPLTMGEGEADADRLAARAGEALLWVADIVAGFVRAAKLDEPRYREILGEKVTDFPVNVL